MDLFVDKEKIVWILFLFLIFLNSVVKPELEEQIERMEIIRLSLEKSAEEMRQTTESFEKSIKELQETQNKSEDWIRLRNLMEITSSLNVSRCEEIKEEVFQILCVGYIVNETQDYTKCWQINESSIVYNNSLRDWCFYFSALVELKNASLCNYVSNTSLRQECFLRSRNI
ncbi:MAG: hypothetical protein OH319_01205 [Candidatus Parvarchaeota archaeon]|nr:hypothetical protein [Candidatus Jingweiarchaeum tengchongense]MCW1297811.1 hypothetical protein [Candidatus Jingweiarchaeum tengchongense]MCW1299821.1 hypothetical protein [Candidatus Jingweiarchaeum tengchongense]MCW1304208.1 hypothetical protein [Candidatus Jingweiarchaeum tengchongense]MCW1305236.1 hypothetical protein [Candidatus Jingweiarchaeum tengchongense]